MKKPRTPSSTPLRFAMASTAKPQADGAAQDEAFNHRIRVPAARGSRAPAGCGHPAAFISACIAKQKTGPKGPVFATSAIDREELQLFIRRRGGLIWSVLDGFLWLADSLLPMTPGFLHHAFALQAIRTGSLTDALLGLTDGFVGGAFNLVCRATHGNTPVRFARRTMAGSTISSSCCLVCDRGFLYYSGRTICTKAPQ